MAERIWYIKQCRLFEQLSPEDLARLERHARVRKFSRNSTIYLPNDPAESVYVLTEGRVRLASITSDGKQAILGFFEAGDLFGELSVAGAEQREEYAEAVADSTVVAIPRADLSEVMLRNGTLSLAVTRLIGWRRQKLERRLRNLLFRSNRERLIGLLWELLERYGKQVSDGTLIDIKLSHQDLASLIGVTRESVTLLLGELQLEGVVKVGRQRIVISDVQRLANMAGEKRANLTGSPDASPHIHPSNRVSS